MYGLVLEGGGARGSYHIGAYKALMEEGVEIKGVTGTSIGAINGAMIVQGDFDLAYELWNDLNYSMVINANDEEIKRLKNKKKIKKEDILTLKDVFKALLTDRGFDISPFKDLLDTYIDEDRIRSSTMDFGIVTVNLTDFKHIEIFKENIPNGEMKDYLLASAYLPAFKSEKIKGKVYLDGAFYDNLPFGMLESRGYKDLILVRTKALGITKRYHKDGVNVIEITPKEDIGTTFEFDSDIAKKNIQLGYFDGLKAIRGLKGERYYFEPEGEEFYFDMLLSIEEESINDLRKIIKIPEVAGKRALFEYFIPKVGNLIGLDKSFTYEDFILMLLEKKAEMLGINKFRIYKYEELYKIVKDYPIMEKNKDDNMINKMLGKGELAKVFNKNTIISNVADVFLNI